LEAETEVLGENLPQCRFVHHKPHMLPGRDPGPSAGGGKPAINRLSHGTPFGFIKKRTRNGTEKMYLHIPPRAPHTYDFVVLTSLTHPRKNILVVLQIGK
jgi:hypothetical protein